MKNSLIFILILSILSCSKDTPNVEQDNQLMNADNLESLDLSNLEEFWGSTTLATFSNYFSNYQGFSGGIGLRNESSEKTIGVAVFESRTIAIECMTARINTVPSIIQEGEEGEEFNDKWWFSDGTNSSVFVCQGNTIIEVSYIPSDYNETKELLINTSIEIANRVYDLSE